MKAILKDKNKELNVYLLDHAVKIMHVELLVTKTLSEGNESAVCVVNASYDWDRCSIYRFNTAGEGYSVTYHNDYISVIERAVEKIRTGK